ncbi:N-acetylglutamate synthase-like GNAT family acetyltransferase [Peribacillus deserti]|uniref:N-acetylglutamate synthase-like GNAT family acetyltransferase n=1 Tax=Peribacillus deserti TaxID=673318 RepID=A0ABS2QDU4_9BACI|nr:GNAT family N-acetyltransferase [Peribacillus deserti]MBM7690668.1 N-acetylglutamate synthase-like GNAT family acetyltransferase [Peribacillus deserti]
MIRCAKREDREFIERFLAEANLSTEGVKENIEHFLIAENQAGKLAAVIGIEPLKETGLLRSLAFSPEFHTRNLPALFEQVFFLAREKGLKILYLATNSESAIGLFQWLGFESVRKPSISADLELSTHGKHLLGITSCEFLCKRI